MTRQTHTHPLTRLSFLLVTLGLLLLAASVFSSTETSAHGPGAIWTTTSSCGDPQNVNHYEVGDTVYINGAGFTRHDGGSISWSITGQPGQASSDPGIVVASGNASVDGDGAFCFAAYVVQPGDDGEYKAEADGKHDNYRVKGEATPTATATAIATATATATGTFTPTSTASATFTPTATATTATATATATFTPTATATSTPTATATSTPTSTATASPTATATASPTATATSVSGNVDEVASIQATGTLDPASPEFVEEVASAQDVAAALPASGTGGSVENDLNRWFFAAGLLLILSGITAATLSRRHA
jgi:hypothetical protein